MPLVPPIRVQNQPVELFRGSGTARLEGASLPVDVSLALDWVPVPGFAIRVTPPSAEASRLKIQIPDVEIVAPDLDCGFRATLTHDFSRQVSDQYQYVGLAEQLGGPESAAQIVLYLVNAPEAMGRDDPLADDPLGIQRYSQRDVEFRSGPWKFALAALPYPPGLPPEGISRSGGYELTHRLDCARRDGAAFGKGDVVSLAKRVGMALSFVRGAWTSPVIGVSGGQGRESLVLLPVKVDARPMGRDFLPMANSQHLADALALLIQLAEQDVVGRAFFNAMPLVVEAASHVEPETAIVLAQQALETLAWARAVRVRGVISAEGFDKLPASDKLRLLLSLAGIPTALPAVLADRLPSRLTFRDGPHFLTEARNGLVHGFGRGRDDWVGSIAGEAAELGREYVDLAVLSLAGYEGPYRGTVFLENPVPRAPTPHPTFKSVQP